MTIGTIFAKSLTCQKTKIEVAVNGENLGKDLDITDIPDKLYVKIGKGYFNVQFQ